MRRMIPSTMSLLAFEAAARHLSFSKAAADLHLTQSAVSKQVAGLEGMLGVSLFQRERQRLRLTEAGHMLQARIPAILDQAEAAMLEVIASNGQGGLLQLAVVPTFATKWLIPRLPRFIAANPHTTINITTKTEPFDFAGTHLDAAIHYGAPNWPNAACDYLMGEECVVIASPELAQQLKEPADVRNTTLIHQSTRPNAWRDWLAHVGVQAPGYDQGPRLELFSMIAQAVRAGLGIALVPQFLVAEELAAGQLVMPFREKLVTDFAYYLVYPHHKATLSSLKAFRGWLLDASRADAVGASLTL